MKNKLKILTAVLLSLILIFSTAACDKKTDTEDLWTDATYSSDTVLGDGANTVKVEIIAQDKSITLTVKTDKATLGDALYEHGIINDPSYFVICNGMVADWDADQAYWAFYVGDEMAMYGVNDEQAVTAGEPSYKIVYTQ